MSELKLRPYKLCDAKEIVSWIEDEATFYKWSANRMGTYPLTAEKLHAHHEQFADSDSFFAMVAYEEEGIVGHLIMRFLDEDKKDLRFGFIIVDGSKRGSGYGYRMLDAAIRYGFEFLQAERISLGVFANNGPAKRCYERVGMVDKKEREWYEIRGEKWECIEMEYLRETYVAQKALTLTQAIGTRRSIRKFKEQSISGEILQQIIQQAAYAPSWKNTQISRYNLVESAAVRKQIADRCVMGFTHNAGIIEHCPVLIVQSYVEGRCGYERDGSYTTSKGDRWQMYDAGIAAQTLCLAAHNAGLGTVIMGIFDEEEVAKVIALPEGEKVAALIAVGYPDETPNVPPRKSIEEIMRIL